MKNNLLNPVKLTVLAASLFLVCENVKATSFTAVASGKWSSSLTWSGGIVPPFNLSGVDQVTIGTGLNVMMDSNVTVNNLLATINVTGTLSSASNITLNLVSGSISGTGNISVTKAMLNATGVLTFSGNLTVDTLVNSIASLTAFANTMVSKQLVLSGIMSVQAGGTLTMGLNSDIAVAGGNLSLNGGTLNLSSAYNVSYVTSSATTGLELSGSGLGNVTINVGGGNSVTLNSNLVVNGSLNMLSGTLSMWGFSVTLNGQLTGSASLLGDVSSNLTINTTGGLLDSLHFANGFQILNNLTVNVGSSNTVTLASALTVGGTLTLSGGSMLNISGQSFTLNGNLSGTGSFDVNGGTTLTIKGTSSLSSPINISGVVLGNFNLDLATGDTAMLGTILNVDTLNLMSGILNLNSKNLSVTGNIIGSGLGLLASTSNSSISVSGSTTLSGSLSFTATMDSVKNLTLNIGGGGNLNLGSALTVTGTLDLMNGHLDIGSNNLIIGATGTISGASSISYIITGKGGYLTMNVSIGKTTIFAVGDSINFFPASIYLNTGSSSGTIGVNVTSGVYANGTSGTLISGIKPMVNATWEFQNNIGSGINANMTLSWEGSAEVNGFINSGDYISHYISGAWDNIGDSMTAALSGNLYTISRANITSMSPFAVFDQKTYPTSISEIVNQSSFVEFYPNPVTTNLTVKNTSDKGGLVNGEIYNAIGQVVSRFQFNNSVISIPVSNLITGNYYLKLYNDNFSVVRKFIKL